MTTPNTPGQQPATQQWGAPQQTSYQWGQQAPYPAAAPAQPRRQVSLPWWPTWATLGLFLLTLIGSFFRFSTVRTYIGQALIDELGLGDIGLDLGDSLGSVTVGMSWWGNFTMEGSGMGSLAMENQDEILSDPDLQMVMVMFAVITALVLVCYGIALILGFFKKNLAMVIVGMVAVLTQALALVMVAVGQGSALEEVGEAGEVSLEAGFWIWLAAAVADSWCSSLLWCCAAARKTSRCSSTSSSRASSKTSSSRRRASRAPVSTRASRDQAAATRTNSTAAKQRPTSPRASTARMSGFRLSTANALIDEPPAKSEINTVIKSGYERLPSSRSRIPSTC